MEDIFILFPDKSGGYKCIDLETNEVLSIYHNLFYIHAVGNFLNLRENKLNLITHFLSQNRSKPNKMTFYDFGKRALSQQFSSELVKIKRYKNNQYG